MQLHPSPIDRSGIDIESVQVVFETDETRTIALDNFSLSIRPGEFVSIVGPSGCGKSTLLNLIAGLRRPAAGRVLYGGEVIAGPNRHVGFVTQQDNLLPWRTVRGNIGLALEVRHGSRADRENKISSMIELVGLRGFEGHYPSELSGGMRKRVTLARTLIYQPQALLLDEPFGALDAQLRLVLQAELLSLWSTMGSTVLFITHDLEEAILLADRVVVLSARPGTIRLSRAIDLPRPRQIERLRFEPDFRKLYAELWEHLKPELQSAAVA